jgi:hypothetical protein
LIPLRTHNTQEFLGLLTLIFGALHALSCVMLPCRCPSVVAWLLAQGVNG